MSFQDHGKDDALREQRFRLYPLTRSAGRRLSAVLAARWLPWALAGLILLFALIHEVLQQERFAELSPSGQVALWALALLGLLVVYLVFSRVAALYEQREKLMQRLEQAEQRQAESYQRLEAIFQVSQKFTEASDENEVIQPLLRLLVELSGAQGATFVPLDEHGQPQTAISHGELPFPVMEAWVEYLATPGVRERCRNCELARDNHLQGALEKPENCPLLKGPFAEASGLLCLPVRRGEREFGVVNLFLPEMQHLDERIRPYLRALIDETALGLEGILLRRNELAALRQMQSLRQKTDLKALLGSLLENVHRSLEADFAMLVISQPGVDPDGDNLTLGNFPQQARPFVEGLLQGVMASKEAMLLGDVSGDPASAPGLRALIASPLLSPEGQVLGAILVGNRRARSFYQRQLALLQTVAGQVALVVQNANLMAELEYQATMQERLRLAREIHDGLAQTLGFLKLQMAQMRGYLGRGENERARQSADLCYTTLSEAYQDARQAIDGLRVLPSDCGLEGWLEQTVDDFQEISGLVVDLQGMKDCIELPPEVHAQLIRIVQEALSNVRKHANAARVGIACRQTPAELVLEVRDDGSGFSPEDVSMASRHGLRGMRERAELIGADFQVISRPGQGTTIRLRLPFPDAVGSDAAHGVQGR
ncbi:MAG: GAF domain-containing protein [Chloroflexota bacterium]